MGLAIDVGICCPLAKSRLREADSKEVMARVKHRLYDHGFSLQSTYSFGAMIMETSGAVNQEGTSILKRLFRFASRRWGVSHSQYCARAWARLSCQLQTSVAQNILNSIPPPSSPDHMLL